jgi:PAS domain S-box-containing protein
MCLSLPAYADCPAEMGGSSDWDILTGKMTYSPRARSIFGFGPEDSITIEMVREATHPDDLPRTSAMSRRALDPAIRDKQPFEYRLIHRRTGETRWVLAHGDAIFAKVDGTLKAVRFLGTIEDITERKSLEQKLLDADVTRVLAFEAAGMAVWEFDLVNEELSVTSELKALFGFQAEEHPTLEDFRNCYLPGQREVLRKAAETAQAAGSSSFSAEFKIRRFDNMERWMLLRAQFVAGAEGTPTRIVGVLIDIDDRKRAEQQQQIMLRELDHRVKNSLSVVLALASQTFRNTASVTEALSVFQGRIKALALANDALVDRQWGSFDLPILVDKVTAPYREDGNDPFVIDGEPVRLRPTANTPLALVFHELCTNAAKYGALSVPSGKVRLTWREQDGGCWISWVEEGGPPVQNREMKGFGTKLISQILARDFKNLKIDMLPGGVRCEIFV